MRDTRGREKDDVGSPKNFSEGEDMKLGNILLTESERERSWVAEKIERNEKERGTQVLEKF